MQFKLYLINEIGLVYGKLMPDASASAMTSIHIEVMIKMFLNTRNSLYMMKYSLN